ncbi:MAG: SIS domain-containing protein [Fervidobacterium sp.]|nr:SIS domain-containing protein [Fervidobacterium sp.]
MVKGNFDSFYTYREILRVDKLLDYVDNIEPFIFEKDETYVFIGCGSSFNIGQIVSEVLRKRGICSKAITSGEFLAKSSLAEIVNNKYNTAILISRTGTTTETVEVAKLLSGRMKTVGITCETQSPLTDMCDVKFNLDFAHEESIVMTSSFSAIVRLLLNGIEKQELRANDFLEKYMGILNYEKLSIKDHFVFLGYSERYFVSKESALKVEEMALSHTEFYEPLEYRHGPIALLGEKTHVTIFSTGSEIERMLAEELIRKGASVDLLEPVSDVPEFEVQFLVLYSQLLGFMKAVSKGLNPDKPKGLVKSVIL